MSASYIRLEKVSKDYGSFRAVNDLSLEVRRGDIYGFLGPNGSGKSTSIRMILSLIRPTSGRIELFGQDLSEDRYRTLSRIGALIERPDFYEYLSARDNLRLLGRLSDVVDLDRRTNEVLDQVGLLQRSHSKVKTFSQGMKQRLGLAQCLLHQPDLIILDEPANGLDPQGQQEMRNLIRSLNTDHGITIVLSSHILVEIEQIANRMVIINKGKKVVEGNVGELLRGAGASVFITVSRPEDLAGFLSGSHWAGKLDGKGTDPGKYRFKLTREEIPELNRYLTKQGMDVLAIEPVRSLEDYFIRLTSHE